MSDSEPAGGDILVYSKVHDPESRRRLRHRLDELPGVRISASIYEIFTSDWDQGLSEEEVARMQDLIDPAVDTLVYWQVDDGKLVRTSLAGRFA
jgi:hypothetical protein